MQHLHMSWSENSVDKDQLASQCLKFTWLPENVPNEVIDVRIEAVESEFTLFVQDCLS